MAQILIVDDTKDVRDLLAQIVQLGGHATNLAASGHEAVATVEAQPPDLVLLDISMPGMDGLEVLRRWRAQEATRSLPVFMMTAMADEHTRDRALSLGADGYFVKGDFEIDALLKALADQVGAG